MIIEELTHTISEWIQELEEEEGKKVPLIECNETTLILLITLLYQYSKTSTPLSTQILRFIHDARSDDEFEKIFNTME